MTQVLSVKPSLDPEDPLLLQNQHLREHCTKTSKATPMESGGPNKQLVEELPCRRVPDHMTMSRIAYIKRKYVEDEDSYITFRSYCKTMAPVLEERAQVLRLSLEKLRFIDYPESFLRRSVLVNNLLHRLRAEILLQSDWGLPQSLRVPAAFPSYLIAPADATTPYLAFHGSLPPPCLTAQGSPLRKRFRLIRGGELQPGCVQTCGCLYTAVADQYLHLPFSVYKTVVNSCSSAPHSASSSSPSLFQLGSGENRLGVELDVEEEGEDGDEEEEEEEDREMRTARLQMASIERPRPRSRTRTLRLRRRKEAGDGDRGEVTGDTKGDFTRN
ncbi:SERTA domain-containing protein 4 [Osmerus eperlanus]|uniref:SERTA domain-containing protein 4 n=1 Tax=Osmerus eperlanus TaxID=29151 RepID=UPI002E0D921B